MNARLDRLLKIPDRDPKTNHSRWGPCLEAAGHSRQATFGLAWSV